MAEVGEKEVDGHRGCRDGNEIASGNGSRGCRLGRVDPHESGHVLAKGGQCLLATAEPAAKVFGQRDELKGGQCLGDGV